MASRDKHIIESFIPLIIDKLCKAGYFTDQITLSDINGKVWYSHHLKIITCRIVPYNVHIPSFLITPYAQMIESLGISIHIGRDAGNKPLFKLSEFKYLPSAHYLHSFTSMAHSVKEKINGWVIDISYALNAEELSLLNSSKIKNELFQRTFKRDLLIL